LSVVVPKMEREWSVGGAQIFHLSPFQNQFSIALRIRFATLVKTLLHRYHFPVRKRAHNLENRLSCIIGPCSCQSPYKTRRLDSLFRYMSLNHDALTTLAIPLEAENMDKTDWPIFHLAHAA